MSYRKSKITGAVLAALILLLVGLRLAAPGWALGQINARLDHMGDYHGKVGAVSLHLWRGAYEIHDLKIEKATGKVPVPLLSAPLIDLAVSWNALLHGGISATVDFERPKLSLVDGSGKDDSQAGGGVDWRKMLEGLLPIKLDEVRVHDGEVLFRNFISSPQVDLHATHLDAVVTNLTNVRRADQRPAEFKATASVLDGAPMQADARFDSFGDFTDFSFNLKLDNVDLPRLNNLLRAYLLTDVKAGQGDFVMQLDARQRQLNGYAKPLLRHLEVIEWKKDPENPLKLAWKALAATVFELFKNHKDDQFGTRIPIAGRIDKPKVSTLDAIEGILHNAFVEAFKPEFEKT